MRKFLFSACFIICVLNNISFADAVDPFTSRFSFGSVVIAGNYLLAVVFLGLLLYWGSVIINLIKKQEDGEHIEKRKKFLKKYSKIAFIIMAILIVIYGCWFIAIHNIKIINIHN